ncbi:uncharacterized protein BO80DRAFT_252270 [Aspergillus ibericus CBS 121593]|uniref:Uncharacterized protein n=1 Tax=Aspergillus ibericus CBS 121593 TaxID=1448316 RepID=A0A395H7S2_9EURO|nr:hypothetical protein BO80DRAFT_252270 [Aspergillus ibericus CBS 121593]RAL03962.1 hypothetical protein BO80DRAFT_252270 [Aspergillus ibericus CBS 121593]
MGTPATSACQWAPVNLSDGSGELWIGVGKIMEHDRTLWKGFFEDGWGKAQGQRMVRVVVVVVVVVVAVMTVYGSVAVAKSACPLRFSISFLFYFSLFCSFIRYVSLFPKGVTLLQLSWEVSGRSVTSHELPQ